MIGEGIVVFTPWASYLDEADGSYLNRTDGADYA
jgi:hypothetical protein